MHALPIHRIYVAGPYTADTEDRVRANIARAVAAAAGCMFRGHDVHCPHAATRLIDLHLKRVHEVDISYQRWLRLDFSIIRHWATALLYLRPSPGTDEELALARELGRTIFWSVDEVPWVGEGARV